MKMLNALVLSVALSLILTPSVDANLIINGSFETPDVGPGISSAPIGGWDVFYAPILGWTPATGNGLEIQDHVIGSDGTAWSAYDGNQLAEPDAYANSGFYQTVNTFAGHDYNFSFAYSPRPALIPASSGLEVYINDGLLFTITTSGVGLWNTNWSILNYSFKATGGSTTIKFMSTGISDGGSTLIDDVRLIGPTAPVPTPEPSTMLLLGCGFAGLVGYGRRRMKK
jgi:PEP-CTERM motif